jgi:uracil-DNA glycosylase family 4
MCKYGRPKKVVRGYGGTGGLCIIGEGPGSTELQQGYPFVGPSGKVVGRALALAGVDRSDVFMMNALLCAKPSGDEAANVAMAHCRARLVNDLVLSAPTAICALGGMALHALQVPYTGISQARGTTQFSKLIPNVPIIGSIHPSSLLRGGAGEMKSGGKQKMNVDAQALFLFSDIEKAHNVAVGKVNPIWSDDIMVIHDPKDVAPAMFALLNDIYDWGLLGLDLEWICPGHKSALDALGADGHLAQITWVGVACGIRGVSFKFEALLEDHLAHGGGDVSPLLTDREAWGAFPSDPSGLMLLQAAMGDPRLPKIMHNKQADIAIWEAKVGNMLGRRVDTMLLHHAAYPGIDHDLQQVVSQHLCVPPWKVLHKQQIQEFKIEQRRLEKEEREKLRTEQKMKNKAAHEALNAEKKAQGEIDRAAKKALKKAEHDARNAQSAADAAERKATKKKKKPTMCYRDATGKVVCE